MVIGSSAGIALLYYFCMSQIELTVTDKRVFGKAIFGKRVDLPLDKISAVATCALGGIAVTTSSGYIKFLMITNRSDVYEAVNNLLLQRQEKPEAGATIKQEIPLSNADELKKYKDLLDQEIISQAEFDQKKKDLLGL